MVKGIYLLSYLLREPFGLSRRETVWGESCVVDGRPEAELIKKYSDNSAGINDPESVTHNIPRQGLKKTIKRELLNT